MHLFTGRPEFQHFSRDHNATPRLHRRKRIDHGTQRLRIGIVAIVDDRDVTQLENLPALVGRRESQPARRRLPTAFSPRARPTATAASAFRMLCSPTSGKRACSRTAGDHHVKLRSLRAAAVHILRPHVGCGSRPVGDHLALEVAAELRNVFVVGIEHSRSAGGQRLNQFVLRPRNSSDRIKKLQMHGSNVGDHANLGLRDFRQRANLARMRHPHFDDRDVMLRFQFQEHERQAEMIIEVAFGLEHAKARTAERARWLPWSSSSPPNR